MFKFNYNNNRIIAIGDIHGDYLIFIELLKLSKVIDNNLNWIGNNTFIIQLGDTLDGKRPNVKIDNDFLNTTGEIEITELILKLDKKAKVYGGRVISILGNHELYPYYFNNDKSFNDKYVKKVDLKEYKKRFKMDRFKYYQPGKPGAILLGKTRPLIVQLGKFIFTHGSLNIDFVKGCLENNLNITSTNYVDINKVNKIVSDWLCGKSNKVPFFINSSDNINPLFDRSLTDPIKLESTQCINKVDNLLKYFPGAQYLVMGHSTHKNINSMCNNKIYRTDVALSRAFGEKLETNLKRLQVLEIKQGRHLTTKIIKSN